MKIVCGWCLADMGEKEPLDDPTPTHGLCSKCKPVVYKECGLDAPKEDEPCEQKPAGSSESSSP